MNNRHFFIALYSLSASIMMALIIGPILRGGMFIDGLLYTNIAKNMAIGLGSFWHPMLDKGSVLYGHPPLLFWLESLFFRVFGNHLFVEDIYNFTILSLTIGLMYGIWQEVVQSYQRIFFFFPLLLWVLSQEVQLRYPNTMLECGMTVFLLASTLAYLKSVKLRPILADIFTGLGAFIAILCKGPAGLFVLGLPLLYSLIVEKRIRISSVFLPFITFAICFSCLFIYSHDALFFFKNYANQQIFPAIQGKSIENVADSRFSFIKAIIVNNIPAIIISVAIYLYKPKMRFTTKNRKGTLLIALGLSAILPLVISTKQAAYYQLPALPFLFLGIGVLLIKKVETLTNYLAASENFRKLFVLTSLICLIATTTFAYTMIGTIDRRDHKNIERAKKIALIMTEAGVTTYGFATTGENVFLNKPLHYPLTGHLNRRHNIQFDSSGNSLFTLLISQKTNTSIQDGIILYQDESTILLRQE